MTLFQAPILTNGATHSAQQFRMLVRDLARGAEGITEGDDLKVTALGTPGTSVQVADGSGVIRGRANTFQGSYTACNIGFATIPITSTGGSPRSDMVVLRVLDPEYEGSLDPETDPIVFFDVISNVSSTATTVTAGYTAIPLARIDIPASTSVITSGMIVDLRQCANPRRSRDMYTQSPTSMATELGGSTSYSSFSTAAGWSIPIPAWATKAVIRLDIGGLRYSTANYFGGLHAFFGSSLTTQNVVLDDNQGTGVRRGVALTADTLTIPSGYRGTTQVLRPQAAGGVGNAGRVSVDTSTTLIADVEFFEAPR